MLKHADIWAAIDRLAHENGLTASGLARRAGLDPTTFNRSKRMTREGKPRWPSTESIAKILDATSTALTHFVALVRPDQVGAIGHRTAPLVSLAELCQGEHFDSSGCPAGEQWDEFPLPEVADPHAYAIEVSGDTCEPIYRDGDVLIVSPSVAARRGDRVLVRTTGGDVFIRRLLRQTAKRIELQPLGRGDELSLAADDVASVARIVWATQ